MTRQKIQIDRCPQFDLFGAAATSDKPARYAVPSSRQFVAPDPREIYLGQTRLADYLKQAGMKEPFVVSQLLDQQDWSVFERRYAASGRAPYAPRCMLGLILYGIMQGVSSLRGLEKLARPDLGCQWVSGGIYPDHANIGRFILLHEASLSGGFFAGLTRSVLKATKSGSERLAGDGTVVEAACSYYRLLKGEAAAERAQAARAKAQSNPDDVKCQQVAAQAEKGAKILKARQEAKQAQGKKSDRLCLSATDPEAVMQPLKRGRGKALAYKASVLANEARVVVALDVHGSSETAVLPALLDQSQEIAGQAPEELLLDAGYFSDGVIKETLARDISLLCPESQRPGQPKTSSKYFTKGQFRYLPSETAYLCPAGERLYRTGHYKGNEQAPGYEIYSTSACAECLLRSQCTRNKTGRRVKRYAGDEAKDGLREVMQHRQAKKIFSKRQGMVEPVFSALRGMQGLNRFRRTGLSGIKREFALHILAYNLSRVVASLGLYWLLRRLLGEVRSIQGLMSQWQTEEHKLAGDIV